MKFCPNCGTQTDDSHPFCSKCGYKFAPMQQNPNSFSYQTPPVQQTPQTPIKKKKSKAPLIIAIAAVVVLAVLAALFFFTNVFGNHIMCVERFTASCYGETMYEVEREFDSNGDTVKKIVTNYSYDGEYIVAKTITTYEYDGKHNLTGYTVKITPYDDLGEAGEPRISKYDVEGYKEDGFWYYDVYDEDHNFVRTDVYDKHRNVIRELDENGYISYEAEYEYDFFGRLVSVQGTTYYEDTDTLTTTTEYEYDGDEMTGTYTKASDWDKNEEFYETWEAVYDWSFYYFW